MRFRIKLWLGLIKLANCFHPLEQYNLFLICSVLSKCIDYLPAYLIPEFLNFSSDMPVSLSGQSLKVLYPLSSFPVRSITPENGFLEPTLLAIFSFPLGTGLGVVSVYHVDPEKSNYRNPGLELVFFPPFSASRGVQDIPYDCSTLEFLKWQKIMSCSDSVGLWVTCRKKCMFLMQLLYHFIDTT